MNNQKKKEVSIASIQVAIQSLIKQGLKPSQRNVAKETGLSIITIKRHWEAINQPVEKVSAEFKKVSPELKRYHQSVEKVSSKSSVSKQQVSSPSEKVSSNSKQVSSNSNQVSSPSNSFQRLKQRRVAGDVLKPNSVVQNILDKLGKL